MEAVTDTHPALDPLPIVDIYESPGVYAVLDEGCNSTVHGTEWVSNAARKLSSLGYGTRLSELLESCVGTGTSFVAEIYSDAPAPDRYSWAESLFMDGGCSLISRLKHVESEFLAAFVRLSSGEKALNPKHPYLLGL